MGYAAKWLGVVVAAAAIAPFGNLPMVLGEPWDLLPPAVAQSESADDRLAEADRLLEEGIRLYEASQFQKALQSYQQALGIYREQIVQSAFAQRSRLGEGRAIHNSGLIHTAQGDHQQALEFYAEGLSIFHELGDADREVIALGNLGSAYHILGLTQQAIEAYDQQLAIIQSANDDVASTQVISIQIYQRLTSIYNDIRDINALVQTAEAGLQIAEETDDIESQAFFLLFLAENYGILGNYSQAITFGERVIKLARMLNEPAIEALALVTVAEVYDYQGRYQEAIDTAEQAFQMSLELESPWVKGYALNVMASAHASLRNYSESILAAQKGIDIATEHDLPGLLPKAWLALMIAYVDLGDYEAFLDVSRSFFETSQPSTSTAIENFMPILNALERIIQNIYMLTQGQYQDVVNDISEFDISTLSESTLVSEHNIQGFQGVMQLLLAIGLGGVERYDEALNQASSVSNTFQGHDEMPEIQGTALFLEGGFYRRLGDLDLALDKYRQASILGNEFYIDAGIARVYRDMNMPDLAISYYKKAINQVEEMVVH